MRKIKVYIDSYNSLNTFVYDNEYPDITPLHLKDEGALRYIKLLEKFNPIDVIEDSRDINIIFKYNNFDLELYSYANILMNERYKDALIPICKKAYDCLMNKTMNKDIGNKVIRKNKYTGKKIFVSALISVILGSSIYSLDRNIKMNNTEVLDISNIMNGNTVSEEIVDITRDAQIKTNNIVTRTATNTSYNNSDATLNSIFLNYKDRSRDNKIMNTDLSYGDIIGKYSKMYGLDANLMLAIATQERGEHSESIDPGGAIGLMQIQYSVWANSNIKAYNFNSHSWEEISIDGQMLSDLEYNVKIACMIFQTYLRAMNYNICAATQSYNMGCGTIERLIKEYASSTNKTFNQVLSSQTDIGWIENRDSIPYGDQSYLEHVLSYCGNDINLNVLDPNNNRYSLTVSSLSKEKQRV